MSVACSSSRFNSDEIYGYRLAACGVKMGTSSISLIHSYIPGIYVLFFSDVSLFFKGNVIEQPILERGLIDCMVYMVKSLMHPPPLGRCSAIDMVSIKSNCC